MPSQAALLFGVGIPHQLIMAATPIPRSLTMIAYIDLVTSSIMRLENNSGLRRKRGLAARKKAENISRLRNIKSGIVSHRRKMC